MRRALPYLLVSLLCWSLGAIALTQEPTSATTLAIEGAKESLLSSEMDWGEVPDFVKGATLLRPATGNVLHFKFHTRKAHPPFILLPAAEKVAAIAKAPVQKSAVHSLAFLKPPLPGPAAAAGKAVLLRSTEPDHFEPFELRGTLLRELVRQAVLLAAREELGLSTRDETLHEYWSEGPVDGPLPLDVIVSATEDHRVKVNLCRMRGMEIEILWDEEIRLPPEEDLILALTQRGELLSRQDFVQALRRAGYEGKANPSFDDKPVPEEVSAAKLHLITQFAAARQLHQLIKEEGESPERLVALARIYAHMGMLSGHFWYQGHKAFMARSLLYAQRAIVRWPQSATVLNGRAYVRALAGLHGAALDDLAAVGKLQGGDKPPEWMTGIENYCRYDWKKINELGDAKPGLPRFLKLLAHNDAGTVEGMIGATEQVLQEIGDSDRAMDTCFQQGQLDLCNWSANVALKQTSLMTLPFAEKIPGLPATAAEICQAESKARAASAFNPRTEFPRRGKFIEALREAAKTELDRPEPSWQVLATLIEEMSFVQIQRGLTLQKQYLAVSAEDSRVEMAPTVSGHPLQAFLQSFRDDSVVRREYLAQLVKSVREPDLSLNQFVVFEHLDGLGLPEEDRLGKVMTAHQDYIASDLRRSVKASPEHRRKDYCREWRRVSPHCPMPFALTIDLDWKSAAPFAAEWERRFSKSSYVQLALGQHYLREKEYAAAVRCLEQSATVARGIEVTDLLATAWLEQKDEKKWKATWDKYLSEDRLGLSNAQAQVAVAEQFMSQGRYEEALPYAETAAESYASWALKCMGDCLTGLKRYDEADKYMEANARRYPPNGAIIRYYWRVRTNQGDMEKARQEVLGLLNDPETSVQIYHRNEGAVHVLLGQKEEALKKYRQYLVKRPDPFFGWMVAILADELQDPRNRDIAFGIVVETGDRPEFAAKDFVELAQLCQAALKEPTKLDALPKQVDVMLARVKQHDRRYQLAYLAGRFLDLHGRKAEGEALLKLAAESPITQVESALAAKELRDKKLKQETKEGEKKE